MPFEVLETIPKMGAKSTMATISYRRSKRGNKPAKGAPKLVVTIPRAVIGDYVPPKGTRFEFHFGSGADFGKARVMAAAAGKGGIEPTTFKGTMVFRFGHVPRLGLDAADGEHVPARLVAKGVFELDLPPWFKPEPVSQKRVA